MNFEPSAPIEVPKIISDEQIQSFVQNGYLVVPDLLSLDEIAGVAAGYRDAR